MAIGKLRNTKCPCGSGRKYKYCCWDKDVAQTMPKRNITTEWLEKRAKTTKQYGKIVATELQEGSL